MYGFIIGRVFVEAIKSLMLRSGIMEMTKKEMDKLRSSVLYQGETLYVIYDGKLGNFPKDTPIPTKPRFAHKSGLPYPQPKWIACEYQIDDSDGDTFTVARKRYGELYAGFSWCDERGSLQILF